MGPKVMGVSCTPDLFPLLNCIIFSLPAKVYLVKAMVFPVDMYGCESWSIRKTVCRRIDAFEL